MVFRLLFQFLLCWSVYCHSVQSKASDSTTKDDPFGCEPPIQLITNADNELEFFSNGKPVVHGKVHRISPSDPNDAYKCFKKDFYCFVIDGKIYLLHEKDFINEMDFKRATKEELEQILGHPLTPILVESKDTAGHIVVKPLAGGMRQIYEETSKILWKNFHFLIPDEDVLLFMKREKVLTKLANSHFRRVKNKIKMRVEIIPHKYTRAENGWTSQKKVFGMRVHEYREMLKATNLELAAKFEKALDDFKLEYHLLNTEAHKLVEAKFDKRHFYKGQYVSDIDLGSLHFDSHDLNNCLIDHHYKGTDQVPFLLKCFDI